MEPIDGAGEILSPLKPAGPAFYAAHLKVVAGCGGVEQDATNPQLGDRRYSSLHAVMSALHPALQAAGMTWIQKLSFNYQTKMVRVTGLCVHVATGEADHADPCEWSIDREGGGKSINDMQRAGLVATYLKRYMTTTYFCMKSETDNDAAPLPGDNQQGGYQQGRRGNQQGGRRQQQERQQGNQQGGDAQQAPKRHESLEGPYNDLKAYFESDAVKGAWTGDGRAPLAAAWHWFCVNVVKKDHKAAYIEGVDPALASRLMEVIQAETEKRAATKQDAAQNQQPAGGPPSGANGTGEAAGAGPSKESI